MANRPTPTSINEDVVHASTDELSQKPLLSDSIRVKVDEINKLAQLVSGINADRAHCEQQNKALIQLLVESEKELKMLQESVKQLQIKTDANVKSQMMNAHESIRQNPTRNLIS